MIQTCDYTADCHHTWYDWLPSWTSLDPVVHTGCHLSQLQMLPVSHRLDQTHTERNVCTPCYVGLCCIVSSCSYSEIIFYSAIADSCYIIWFDYLTVKIPSVLWHCWLVTGRTSCLDDVGRNKQRLLLWELFCNSQLQCVDVHYGFFSVDIANFNIWSLLLLYSSPKWPILCWVGR